MLSHLVTKLSCHAPCILTFKFHQCKDSREKWSWKRDRHLCGEGGQARLAACLSGGSRVPWKTEGVLRDCKRSDPGSAGDFGNRNDSGLAHGCLGYHKAPQAQRMKPMNPRSRVSLGAQAPRLFLCFPRFKTYPISRRYPRYWFPAFFVRPLAEFPCAVHSATETVLCFLPAPLRSQMKPASKVVEW